MVFDPSEFEGPRFAFIDTIERDEKKRQVSQKVQYFVIVESITSLLSLLC